MFPKLLMQSCSDLDRVWTLPTLMLEQKPKGSNTAAGGGGRSCGFGVLEVKLAANSS